jgi:hypothetical protein
MDKWEQGHHGKMLMENLQKSLIFAYLFTVLEYSPIGVKFPLITAPPILYTVKKKMGKFLKSFLF